jgi:hypothetical protein
MYVEVISTSREPPWNPRRDNELQPGAADSEREYEVGGGGLVKIAVRGNCPDLGLTSLDHAREQGERSSIWSNVSQSALRGSRQTAPATHSYQLTISVVTATLGLRRVLAGPDL